MAKYTIDLTETEEKALLTDMISIQEWISNAILVKAEQVTNDIVRKLSDKQPEKMTRKEKAEIIKNATLETAEERTKRLLPK